MSGSRKTRTFGETSANTEIGGAGENTVIDHWSILDKLCKKLSVKPCERSEPSDITNNI